MVGLRVDDNLYGMYYGTSTKLILSDKRPTHFFVSPTVWPSNYGVKHRNASSHFESFS